MNRFCLGFLLTIISLQLHGQAVDLPGEEAKRKALEAHRLKRKQDSLAFEARKKIILLREQELMDSILRDAETKEVVLLPNEKYEEVSSKNIDNLKPGFYLIANVFGTEKYFRAFMRSMTEKGLEPKSFYRSQNKYNYVYLKRYTTIEEARKVRNSNFNGRYQGKTWVFRVRK